MILTNICPRGCPVNWWYDWHGHCSYMDHRREADVAGSPESFFKVDYEDTMLPFEALNEKVLERFAADHETWERGLLREFDEEVERARLQPVPHS